jgi:hypothetical protein
MDTVKTKHNLDYPLENKEPIGSALQQKSSYSDWLNTDEWRDIATRAYARDGFRCRICNSPDNLHAHHRTYAHRGNELHHLEDLTTLCGRCHKLYHHIKRANEGNVRLVEPQKPKEIPKFIPRHLRPKPKLDPALERKRRGYCERTKTWVLNELSMEPLCFNRRRFKQVLTALGFSKHLCKKRNWKKKLYGLVVTEEKYENALAEAKKTLNAAPPPLSIACDYGKKN